MERIARAKSQNLQMAESFKIVLEQTAWTFQLVIDKNI
jgi:hypothetical protein